jgi:ubiquinone/menaquinone biosynthesis C-methylase UbiE
MSRLLVERHAKAMKRSELNEQWRHMAPAWIREVRNGRNATRAGLLDKPMIEACGDVRGLKILDSGCGEGRFCRLLVHRGAGQVLGVDLCEQMINAAQELQTGRDSYHLADVQDLGFLEDHSFDLAVSYLNQCDLPDFHANNRAIFRVLRPGGRFIIANLHPMRSAAGAWQRTNDGLKQHVILDRYFEESERCWKMLGVEFTNFHRTLATYVRGYRQAGFAIDDIIEPTVDAETVQRFPELGDELRVPNFMIMVLGKEPV